MDRIKTSTAVPNMPALSDPGPPGFFTRGNPVGGMPATLVSDDWLNGIQEELASVVLGSGQTLGQNLHQVQDAMRLYARSSLLPVTANGPVTVPAWATAADVEVWCGGGSGGGSSNGGASASGGGGGGYARGLVVGLVPGSQVPCVVASALPGATGGGDGTPGQVSSFGGFVTGTGGFGGGGALNGNVNQTPGTGGHGILAPGVMGWTRSGESGGSGYLVGPDGVLSGAGGGAHGAGMSLGVYSKTTIALIGNSTGAPGQGAPGGVSGGQGGGTSGGLILIRWLA